MIKKLISRLFEIKLFFPIYRLLNVIIFGTKVRASLLNYLLNHYYRSKMRREWRFNKFPPHFEDNLSALKLWPITKNPDFLNRGLFNREVMNKESTVLNIGCGDGLYDSLFYSSVAKSIDAIDIDKSAIKFAIKNNSSENITYYELDCINKEFPKKSYDVVVLDGAIGHFNENDINIILSKIKNVIGNNGIFVGSEELSTLDVIPWDHFQAFPDLIDLKSLLQNFFPFVQTKEISPINDRYREGFFRCSLNRNVIEKYVWV